MIWRVEVGWKKSAYKIKIETPSFMQAMISYDCYNVHSGGKKRISAVYHGSTHLKHRIITTLGGYSRITDNWNKE